MKNNLILTLACTAGLACVACVACVATAHAAPITYTFNGEVSRTLDNGSDDNRLESTFQNGDAFTFIFGIDEDASNTSTDPAFGQYQSNIGGTVSFDNGFVATTTGSPIVRIFDDFFGEDTLSLEAQLTGPQVNGLNVQKVSLALFDGSGTVFDSTALPTDFSYSDFEAFRFIIEFDGGDEVFVDGDITSLSVTTAAVPEPTTALGALTLMGLATLRRRCRTA